MNTPELKEADYVKAWAAFFVSATVVGALGGAVAGGVIGGFLGVAGVAPGTIKLAGAGVGFLVGLPISYFFFRFFVSHFLIRKVSPPPLSDDSPKVV